MTFGYYIYSQNGDTALRWAAFNGNTDTVKQLLERGADIDSSNDVSHNRGMYCML